MRKLSLLFSALFLFMATEANARHRIGFSTFANGLCIWEAFVDVYPNGSYTLTYETRCDGILVWVEHSNRVRLSDEVRMEPQRPREAIRAAREAGSIARRLAAEERRRMSRPSARDR